MNGAYRSRALRRVRRLLAALRRSSSAPEGSSARTETALSGPSWMHRRRILPRLAMEEKTWNQGAATLLFSHGDGGLGMSDRKRSRRRSG